MGLLGDSSYFCWTWSWCKTDFLAWPAPSPWTCLALLTPGWTLLPSPDRLCSPCLCAPGLHRLSVRMVRVKICAHNIWQVLLIEGNKIAFIIRPLSFTILQVTPNIYFYIMLVHQITAGIPHFHLYGTWVHFFQHNCNVIFLILECYASVCFLTLCLSNCNISWFGWYTIRRTAIFRGIPQYQRHNSLWVQLEVFCFLTWYCFKMRG